MNLNVFTPYRLDLFESVFQFLFISRVLDYYLHFVGRHLVIFRKEKIQLFYFTYR